MAKGKRYDGEPKLNMKKVLGVVIALAVLIMIIISISKILKSGKDENTISSVTYFSSYNKHEPQILPKRAQLIFS